MLSAVLKRKTTERIAFDSEPQDWVVAGALKLISTEQFSYFLYNFVFYMFVFYNSKFISSLFIRFTFSMFVFYTLVFYTVHF